MTCATRCTQVAPRWVKVSKGAPKVCQRLQNGGQMGGKMEVRVTPRAVFCREWPTVFLTHYLLYKTHIFIPWNNYFHSLKPFKCLSETCSREGSFKTWSKGIQQHPTRAQVSTKRHPRFLQNPAMPPLGTPLLQTVPQNLKPGSKKACKSISINAQIPKNT